MKTSVQIFKKPILIIACVICFIVGLICLPNNPDMEWFSGYQDVLEVDLPAGVKCTHQRLNTTGRNRTWYDFRGVLEGDNKALLSFVRLLNFQEENRVLYGEPRYMSAYQMKWWNPSWNKGGEYRIFTRRTGTLYNVDGVPYIHNEVLLTSNQLFLVQVGDIKTVRKNFNNRVKLYFVNSD
jgi:hypothetical protein